MATTNRDTAALVDDLEAFLRVYYEEEIAQLAQRYPRDQQSLHVDWGDLHRFADRPGLTDHLRRDPQHVLDCLEHALAEYDLPADVDLAGATVRVHNLPESETRQVDDSWQSGIGEYTAVSGQVSKVSDVKPEPIELAYICQRCGTPTRVPQDGEGVQEPHECQGCERQGPFEVDYDSSEFRPHQLVRIQQPPEDAQGGSGSHIDVHARNDLVNAVQAGDRVDMAGVYSVAPPSGDAQTFEPYMEGKAADIEETDFEEIDVEKHIDRIEAIAAGEYGDPYELLVDSIAPKVRGYETIKEAIGLQLFGGVRVEYPDGSVDRGDSHILLLGDPGTAKSTLLRAVEEIAPRSVYASGKGASAAGMTAAAVADDFGDTKWSLEAGALVLANKGVACVDEIDKVDEDAVSSMHDALESQRVNVNKAGINATLPAQTALLAAGNPKYGRFDPYEPPAEQIDLGPTMLSRFDLLFMVDDQPDPDEDQEIADHIIESRTVASAYTTDPHRVDDDALSEVEPAIEAPVLRAYIAHAKQHCYPRIRDDDVAESLAESFTEFRLLNGDGEDDDAPVPVTFRKLEGILRLAEASARVRLSDTVEMQDVGRARQLVGRSLRDVGMDEEGQYDADVVEAGASKSQRERIQIVKDVISAEAGASGGASMETIKTKAQEAGVDVGRVEGTVKKLKAKGEVYSPGEDEYRVS